ncbi:Bug family tripartite tricarboxylate transporter substrate binding protein [Pigmentiphaga litoralis]|uniref:Tripartite-type tricarboxylate transporter receptor subunit TctC n=1 Tax=Pigmentiphaga litoralis TaxID=516702 RepID=A0A7Y9LJZ0_9BURK|nr:tripartite tricarboxylate transporter substrate-binding protein [Pigmentiphaga litoralis]NYE23932.1 tripartite-type tricarboxylate transporter receptor subunit TctC [Pigmentiphaga litoralis]NYE82454.1 tripartite-type tricarboxylate transporter receptor subunit TctC [Pigmentiphaga litoralis]
MPHFPYPLARWLTSAALASLLAGAPAIVQAQATFPVRPVSLVIGYPPGAIVDTVARQVGAALAPILGQPVVPDNKGGAAGVIGAGVVAKARPDGYTVLFTAYTSLQIASAIERNLAFDPVNDLIPVASVGRPTTLLLVNADFPAKTFDEFIAYVKARPSQINFGTSGTGSPNHFALEHLNSVFGTRMTAVPYKGAAQMLTDMLGGRVQATFSSSSLAAGHLQAGTVRALAIGSPDASPLFPDLPVIADKGAPGFNASGALGLFAPPGTPPAIVDQWNLAIGKALQDPAVAEKLAGEGIIVKRQTAAQFGDSYRREARQIADFIRQGNLKIN